MVLSSSIIIQITGVDNGPGRISMVLVCKSAIATECVSIYNQVLTTTIMEDLAKVNLMVKETSQKLRQERVRLIKLKVRVIDSVRSGCVTAFLNSSCVCAHTLIYTDNIIILMNIIKNFLVLRMKNKSNVRTCILVNDLYIDKELYRRLVTALKKLP